MSGRANLVEQLSELGRAVAEARARLAAGRLVDMSAFEVRLESVCRELEAQGAGAQQHLAILGALRADLEALAEDVQATLATLKAMARVPAGAAPGPGPR